MLEDFKNLSRKDQQGLALCAIVAMLFVLVLLAINLWGVR